MSSLIPVFRHSFKDIVSEIPRTLVVTGNHRKGQVVVEIGRDDGEAVRFLAMPEYNTLTVLDGEGAFNLFALCEKLGLGKSQSSTIHKEIKDVETWLFSHKHPDDKWMTRSEYNRLSDGEEGNRASLVGTDGVGPGADGDAFHEELRSVEDSNSPSPGTSPSQAELDWLNEI